MGFYDRKEGDFSKIPKVSYYLFMRRQTTFIGPYKKPYLMSRKKKKNRKEEKHPPQNACNNR